MLRLFFLLFIFPHFIFAEVIYEKLGVTDEKGREIVSLKIEGPIEKDEYETFSEAINDINQNNYRVQFDSVILNSPGGNVNNAVSIGYLVRSNRLSTWVLPNDECLSACPLILQAGVCKMAEGEVGLHRSGSDYSLPLAKIRQETKDHESYIKDYLKFMDASPEIAWYYSAIPHWDMKYLKFAEKRNFGLFAANEDEMQYRLEIASHQLGLLKSDLIDIVRDRFNNTYPDYDSEENGIESHLYYSFPSCSEQLFLDDSITEHLGINIDKKPEEIFEVSSVDQGIIDEEENLISTDKVPHKEGQSYYYSFHYVAKGKEVSFEERVTVSGPTIWGNDKGTDYDNTSAGIEISDDKSSITVTRTQKNEGFIINSWTITKEDPKGPVKIEILFNDEVISTFNYVIE